METFMFFNYNFFLQCHIFCWEGMILRQLVSEELFNQKSITRTYGNFHFFNYLFLRCHIFCEGRYDIKATDSRMTKHVFQQSTGRHMKNDVVFCVAPVKDIEFAKRVQFT